MFNNSDVGIVVVKYVKDLRILVSVAKSRNKENIALIIERNRGTSRSLLMTNTSQSTYIENVTYKTRVINLKSVDF